MPQTKPHGHKRKHLFKVGDLVRWNRWHPGNIPYPLDGRLAYKPQTRSHLGVVLRVYQSDSPARCWTADVRFMEAEFNSDYWGWNGQPIPLSCLEVT
jgi:hypothetical protein